MVRRFILAHFHSALGLDSFIGNFQRQVTLEEAGRDCQTKAGFN